LAGANRTPEVGDDGILTAGEVAALDLRGTELVVLSACQSGLGQASSGEGMLGLQRAFQKGGAETVVASLWKVPDAETRALMSEFYSNLWRRKLGKAEALRQAQLSLLRLTNGQPAHPSTWAAWVVSGDPGEISLLDAAPVSVAAHSTAALPRAAEVQQSPSFPLWLWLLAAGLGTLVAAGSCLVLARRAQ
jgi:hypothetical protein